MLTQFEFKYFGFININTNKNILKNSKYISDHCVSVKIILCFLYNINLKLHSGRLPGDSVINKSPCNARDTGFNP